MTAMTIGLDAKRVVRNATGLGNYGRTLVNDLGRVMPPDWHLRLYAPDAGRDDLRQQVALSDRVQMAYPRRAKLKVQRALWRMGSIVADLRHDGVRLYHGLTGELPRGLRQAGILGVVTIHDLIFMRHPEYYHWADAKIYEWKFRVACREASRIIAISERTKQDVMELGGVSEDRIDVIYQSCSPRFAAPLPQADLAEVRARYGLQGRLLLSVGTIEERKNIQLAVSALHHLPQEVHLVAVGRATDYSRRVLNAAAKSPLARRIHFLHGVSDHDLQALYQMAEVFVYPSRYEGFGIPIIEAIHSGLPVVAATGSCLEEAGGPDSQYVSPDDPQALAVAIGQVLCGMPGRHNRVQRCREWVQRFEGYSVANQVMDVYRRVLELPTNL